MSDNQEVSAPKQPKKPVPLPDARPPTPSQESTKSNTPGGKPGK